MASQIFLNSAATVLVVSFVVFATASGQSGDVYRFILDRSGQNNLPASDSSPLTVDVSLSLVAIRDVDYERNEVEVVVWHTMMFSNPSLSWKKIFPDVNKVSVQASEVWMPDIEPFNAVDTPVRTLIHDPRVVVTDEGEVIYVPALKVRFACDVTAVFDQGGNCTLTFGSWSLDGNHVDLHLTQDKIDTSVMTANRQVTVMDTFAERVEEKYDCCPETYVSVKYTMKLKAKTE